MTLHKTVLPIVHRDQRFAYRFRVRSFVTQEVYHIGRVMAANE